jgi:hypothetical protein
VKIINTPRSQKISAQRRNLARTSDPRRKHHTGTINATRSREKKIAPQPSPLYTEEARRIPTPPDGLRYLPRKGSRVRRRYLQDAVAVAAIADVLEAEVALALGELLAQLLLQPRGRRAHHRPRNCWNLACTCCLKVQISYR